MDTPIKEPSYLVISWKVLGILATLVSIVGGFIWRLFGKMSKLHERVDKVEKIVEDIHDHETGAASLGKHINLLLERMARQEECHKFLKEDIKEIKDILNKYFVWNGEDRRGKGNAAMD